MKKYEFLAQTIKEQIALGAYQTGSRLPSEHTLCDQFSVSRNVVRQALKTLEVAGITESIQGVGTFIRTEGIVKDRSYTIGFITFFSHSYIFPQIISGADSILHPQGFNLLLGQSLYNIERERKLLKRFLKRKIDGLIIESINSGNPTGSNIDLLFELQNKGIPIICLDNRVEGIKSISIILKDYQAGRKAAEYLIEKGHRNIAIFYQDDYITKLQRKLGAEEYLLAHPEAEEPVCIPFSGQGEFGNGAVAAEAFFKKRTDCTAVFCSSDEDAWILIDQAEKAGLKVPQELSVIGFDNPLSQSNQRIRLTTFKHPSSKIGRLAAINMLEQINHPQEMQQTTIEIEAQFIEGNSVVSI